MNTLEILCGIVALFVALYYYAISNYNYWKDRGVVGPKPVPFFGNIKDIMLTRISAPDFIRNVYDEYKGERLVGFYQLRCPVLLIRDPDLIKDVLIKDFTKFSDRGFNVHERTEPLSQHIFNLETKRWKPMRSKLTPMFTSGKLKGMFGLILESANRFTEYIEKVIETEGPIDIPDLTAKYTIDVIGSCAFGIDMNSLSDEESEFRRLGVDFFAPTFQNVLRLRLSIYAQKFYDLLGYVAPDKKYAPFFIKLVGDTIRYRKEHNIYRPDFMNILMELRDEPQKVGDIELTDTMLAAQVFVFFGAGFETSATTMSNTLYELAQNHKIQDKLREEIREHYKKYNGELRYEQVNELVYLDKVFKETLRKYPPAFVIPRKATGNYTFEGTKASVSPGMFLWIPVIAIHWDPDIYPNPEVFDPERFTEEAIASRHPMTYLPFGDGPRNCIGGRFAVYQSKIGLITIIRNFKVDVCEKTVIPYHFSTGGFLLTPEEGIYLKITKV